MDIDKRISRLGPYKSYKNSIAYVQKGQKLDVLSRDWKIF